ncbi:MAG: Luciferase-like, subgroup [Actinoallomurus sp.]|jgi:hypothetical protein|nr:Luciferase-like, subgroup [Actinoallomurus sp.]
METRRDVIVKAAALADELRYETFAVPEGWGLDSTPVLTEIALRTGHEIGARPNRTRAAVVGCSRGFAGHRAWMGFSALAESRPDVDRPCGFEAVGETSTPQLVSVTPQVIDFGRAL